MPKLPVLSGRDLLKILAKAGWETRGTKGSHVVLVKAIEGKKCATVITLL